MRNRILLTAAGLSALVVVLHELAGAPMVRRPAYVVYRTDPADQEPQALALDGHRSARFAPSPWPSAVPYP